MSTPIVRSTPTLKKTRNVRKISDEEMRAMKKKDHQMVKGIFHCFEPRGGGMTFSFRKYKGDDVLSYTLTDGDKLEVPLMVAKHLNQNCWYPKHSFVLNADGAPSVEIGKKVQRCSFESLEFQDIVDEENDKHAS